MLSAASRGVKFGLAHFFTPVNRGPVFSTHSGPDAGRFRHLPELLPLSMRELTEQMVAHIFLQTRMIEQISYIALGQLREKRKDALDRRVRMAQQCDADIHEFRPLPMACNGLDSLGREALLRQRSQKLCLG